MLPTFRLGLKKNYGKLLEQEQRRVISKARLFTTGPSMEFDTPERCCKSLLATRRNVSQGSRTTAELECSSEIITQVSQELPIPGCSSKNTVDVSSSCGSQRAKHTPKECEPRAMEFHIVAFKSSFRRLDQSDVHEQFWI